MTKRKRHDPGSTVAGPVDATVDATVDGGLNRPFAALSGLRAKLPKQRFPAAPTAKKPSAGPQANAPATARTSKTAAARHPVSAPGGHSREDRVALSQAFAGVRPLAKKALRHPASTATPAANAANAPEVSKTEAVARARLDALVGGGVTFELTREDGLLRALRRGMHADHLKVLLDPEVRPDLEFDLHGSSAKDAQQRLSRFVREAHGRGARTLLIIHGRGNRSPGAPVLGDAALEALTRGGAAPLVSALATAPRALGGVGALLVRLGKR